MKMKTGSGQNCLNGEPRACLRFINGKLHKFQTHWMRLPSAPNEFCATRTAIKRRFIIHPVQWDAASARRSTPCDWTDPADVVFHSVTQAGVVHAHRLLFYACTKNQLFADAARVVPLAPDLSPAPPSIFACKKCSRSHSHERVRRVTRPLPADLWRKLRFNFTADKINRGIGGACWHRAAGKIPEVSLKRA